MPRSFRQHHMIGDCLAIQLGDLETNAALLRDALKCSTDLAVSFITRQQAEWYVLMELMFLRQFQRRKFSPTGGRNVL